MKKIVNYAWDAEQEASFLELFNNLTQWVGTDTENPIYALPLSEEGHIKVSVNVPYVGDGGAELKLGLTYHAVKRYCEHFQILPETRIDIISALQDILTRLGRSTCHRRKLNHAFMLKHVRKGGVQDQTYLIGPANGSYIRFVATFQVWGVCIATISKNSSEDIREYEEDYEHEKNVNPFLDAAQACTTFLGGLLKQKVPVQNNESELIAGVKIPKAADTDGLVRKLSQDGDLTAMVLVARDNLSKKGITLVSKTYKMTKEDTLKLLLALKADKDKDGVQDLLRYVGLRHSVPIDVYEACTSPAYRDFYHLTRDIGHDV